MDLVLNFFSDTLNTFAWVYVLLPCVILGGILFTVKTGAIQFTKFGFVMKNTVGKIFKRTNAQEGSVTPFQAVTTALAATVGTGNMIGTSQAIALGGYGAIFWLWIAALLGMVIKYSEVVLSVRYRKKNEDGDWVGGPMYYITDGMGKKWKWLAVIFAVFAVLASFGIGNLSQANSISSSITDVVASFVPSALENETLIGVLIGVILAAVCAFSLFGGIKRIGRVTELLVPFMSIIYIVCTLIVIGINVGNIGEAFRLIFVGAFTPEAVLGASCGIAFREVLVWGLKRSAFSNEAGLGSAGIAHAAADTKSPVEQGFYGVFEVFVDTVLICTLTGLTVIVSGIDIDFGHAVSSELITAAFSTVFGDRFAAIIVAAALLLFAFSTILGWSLYGSRCVEYLFGTKASKVYRIVFSLVIIVGTTTSLEVVWGLADTFNGLMAIPNFIALFALSGVVKKLTKEYFENKSKKVE